MRTSLPPKIVIWLRIRFCFFWSIDFQGLLEGLAEDFLHQVAKIRIFLINQKIKIFGERVGNDLMGLTDKGRAIKVIVNVYLL